MRYFKCDTLKQKDRKMIYQDVELTDEEKKTAETEAKEKVLEKIIHEAVYVDQHLSIPARLKKKYLANYIVTFKERDNATGAIYKKDV